jgi:hypothetical protein
VAKVLQGIGGQVWIRTEAGFFKAFKHQVGAVIVFRPIDIDRQIIFQARLLGAFS